MSDYNYVGGNNYGNVGGENNTVYNTQNDLTAFIAALAELRALSTTIAPEDQETYNDCIEVIESEVQSPAPKKGLLRRSWETMKSIAANEKVQKLMLTVGECVAKALIK